MSLRKFRRPRLLDKHEAQAEHMEKESKKQVKREQKQTKVVKKKSRKN